MSSNIDSRNFLPSALSFESYNGYFLFSTIKRSIFLVFTSCHKFRLTLCFRLWFGKFSLNVLEKFLETLKLLSLSVGKLLRYLPRFFNLFQYQIHPKYHIFCQYRLILQNNLQFIHIHTGQYLIYF